MATFFSGVASAQTLAASARQLEPGTWKLIPYYQGTRAQDLKFSVRSGAPCVIVGVAPTQSCVFGASDGDVKVHASGGLGMVKLLVQPWDYVQYYVGAGAGSMSLDIPGNAVTTSRRGGWAFVGGVKAVIMPDTVVSPAVAVDISYGLQRYSFDAIGPTPIDQRLDLNQMQVALETSHRFEWKEPKLVIEPYGGVKWLGTRSSLTDNQTGGQAGGIQNTLTPFVGLQLPVYERESVFAEASFVDGVQYAAGAHIRFK